MYYSCIACRTIEYVLTIDKKIHLKVYLEECKYRIKKIQIPKFIKGRLNSDSHLDLDSEVEAKSYLKLIGKLEKSDSDSDFDSEKN